MSSPAPETLAPQLDVAKYFAGPPQTPSVWDKILSVKDWAQSVKPDDVNKLVRYGLDEWGTNFVQRALETASGDDVKPYTVNVNKLLTVGKPGKVEMGHFLSKEVKRVADARKKADWDLKFSKQFNYPEYRQRANEQLTALGERLTRVESLAKIWADPNATAADSEQALSYLDLRQKELVDTISKVVGKLETGKDLWDTTWEGAIAAAQDYEVCAGLKEQVSAKMDQDPVYREQKIRERRYSDLRWASSHRLPDLGLSGENIPVELRNIEDESGNLSPAPVEHRDYSVEHIAQLETVDNALDTIFDIADAAGMDLPTRQIVFGQNLRVQQFLAGNTDLRAGVVGEIKRGGTEDAPTETHTLSFGYLARDVIDSTLAHTLRGAGFERVDPDPVLEDGEGLFSAKFEKTYTSS